MIGCIAGLWLAMVSAGTFLMLGYANTPNQDGLPPDHWPDSSQLVQNQDQPTLIMFIHPHCPCSRASIGELAVLMAHCQGRVTTHVLFLKPAGMPLEWIRTDLWRDASAIPGVKVYCDDEGREARRFHIETSGDTALYDAKGQLLFHGGITGSRGHSGDNAGRDDVESLLFNKTISQNHTPAFGCSLFDTECADRTAE